MMALERLTPLERAAFLLHDVFGVSFEEIAETIGREPADLPPACQPRPDPCPRGRAHAFPCPRNAASRSPLRSSRATRSGDMQELRSLLAADVTLYADGGGKTPARRTPVAGLDNVMRLFAAFASLYAEKMSRIVRYGFINGLPGFVTIEQDDTLQTTALEIARAVRLPNLCRAKSGQAPASGRHHALTT